MESVKPENLVGDGGIKLAEEAGNKRAEVESITGEADTFTQRGDYDNAVVRAEAAVAAAEEFVRLAGRCVDVTKGIVETTVFTTDGTIQIGGEGGGEGGGGGGGGGGGEGGGEGFYRFNSIQEAENYLNRQVRGMRVGPDRREPQQRTPMVINNASEEYDPLPPDHKWYSAYRIAEVIRDDSTIKTFIDLQREIFRIQTQKFLTTYRQNISIAEERLRDAQTALRGKRARKKTADTQAKAQKTGVKTERDKGDEEGTRIMKDILKPSHKSLTQDDDIQVYELIIRAIDRISWEDLLAILRTDPVETVTILENPVIEAGTEEGVHLFEATDKRGKKGPFVPVTLRLNVFTRMMTIEKDGTLVKEVDVSRMSVEVPKSSRKLPEVARQLKLKVMINETETKFVIAFHACGETEENCRHRNKWMRLFQACSLPGAHRAPDAPKNTWETRGEWLDPKSKEFLEGCINRISSIRDTRKLTTARKSGANKGAVPAGGGGGAASKNTQQLAAQLAAAASAARAISEAEVLEQGRNYDGAKQLYATVLGIHDDSWSDQVKVRKGWRQQGRTWHPDKHNNSPVSTEMFQQIQEAWDRYQQLL